MSPRSARFVRLSSIGLLAILCGGGAGPLAHADDAGTLPPGFPYKQATPETLTDEQVVNALTRGLDWLFAQRKNGVWETNVFDHENKRYDGGNTALVLYTLANVGESLKDPRLNLKSKDFEPTIDAVKKIGNSDLVYLKAIQLMALAKIRGDTALTRQLGPLAADLMSKTPATGGYLYRFSDSKDIVQHKRFDNSSTQLALLAAAGMTDVNVELPTKYWQGEEAYWRSHQNGDGGWGYSGSNEDWKKSSPSMSAAGVASLFILNDQLDTQLRLTSKPDKNLDAGLAWMDRNLNASGAFSGGWPSGYFTLFAMQRVGLAAGRKEICGTDWYRCGAAELLKRQKPDGSFPAHYFYHDYKGDIIPTCFAMIFLARGRNPIAFNKLEYPGNTWDARPRDAANLTTWISRTFERAINWQTVNVNSDPEAWLDAPVLLITGSQDPKFSEQQIDHLRAFVQAGGTIFSSADGATQAFNTAIEKLAPKILGVASTHNFRELPKNHPVFSAYAEIKNPPRIMGLSNGLREIWIHSPIDLGASWQTRRFATVDHYIFPVNLFFYAAGPTESLSPRLKALKIAEPSEALVGRISLARLDLGPDSDPEPGAFKRFARLLRRDARTELSLVTVKPGELDPGKTPVAHLTSASPIQFTDDDVRKIRTYLDGGGTLLIDNAGSSDGCNAEYLKLAKAIYPEQDLAALPESSPVFTGAFVGGVKIENVTYRKASLLKHGARTVPEILGIKSGDRYVLVYVPEDLTSGLLGVNTLGLAGYTSETAIPLTRNLLIYAAAKHK